MELRVLRYFLSVAQTGSISNAARELHISQPALSRQLKDLEAEFGTQLFSRTVKGIVLTDEGILLRRRAQELIDLADQTTAEMQADTKEITGCVCIGAAETQAARVLARAMTQMRKQHPRVTFDIFSGNGDDVAERLNRGLVDFALFVDYVIPPNYTSIQLAQKDELGLLVRTDHPLAHKESVGVSDLKDTPLLASKQLYSRKPLDEALGCKPETLTIAGTYNLLFNAALMVEEGLGCAVCLNGIVDTTAHSNLCFIPFKPRREVTLHIAWKKEPTFSHAAQAFLDLIRELEE